MKKQARTVRPRSVRIAAAAVLVLVAVAAALKFFLAPRLMRRQIHRALGGLWRGTVELGRAEFDMSGRARLHRLKLKDPDGRIDLHTRDVDLTVVVGTFLTMNRLGKLLIGDIKEKLFAWQARGTWEARRLGSFAPVAVGQIADGSVTLLADLARTGGQFNTTTIKGSEQSFEGVQPGSVRRAYETTDAKRPAGRFHDCGKQMDTKHPTGF